MKIKILFLVFIAFLFETNSVLAQKKRPASKPKVLSAREIAAKVLPSVVLIITQDENGQPIAQGSGFVYKPGLVVSNLHVLERASNAIVKNVKTGQVSKAIEVVAMNARQDICIIRIDNIGFPAVSIGDSRSVKTGDEIYVASNPKGLEGSFTRGIISSVREKNRTRKNEDDLDLWLRNYAGDTDQSAFQIDAAISPGSSGGVLLNGKAEAIGIIRSTITGGQNLNFAIPIEQMVALPHKFSNPIQLAGACAYTDRKKERLQGLVKKIIERELPSVTKTNMSTAKSMGIELIVSSETTYDLDGNEIESVVYQITDGKLLWRNTYAYDENRLRTSILYNEIITGKIEKTDLVPAFRIKYKLDTRKFSQVLNSESAGIWVYDNAGNLTERRFDGGVKTTFSYDSDGNTIESTQWRNGKISIRNRYRYKLDRFRNWIEQYTFMAFGSENEWSEMETKYREITYYE